MEIEVSQPHLEAKEKKDIYKLSRLYYILESAFQYFIATLVGGAYLASVTKYIGLSDSTTGIVTSFVSLGWTFQMIAIFISKNKPCKSWVSTLSILCQIGFTLIYFVPFFNVSKTAKSVLFIVILLFAHFIMNVVHSHKTNWFMSLVDDKKRGRFTATKEMVSLLGGMVFTFFCGKVIDYYNDRGDIEASFIFTGICIFVLTVLHALTLILSKEKPGESKENASIAKDVKALLKNKTLLKIILVSMLWNATYYASNPFLGSYQINELAFSMTFISVLSAVYAVVRSVFSRPMGAFADKFSFRNMLTLCFTVEALSLLLRVFVVPANGKVLNTVCCALNAISMAGINSSEINLIYDHVSNKERTGALAIKGTLAGLTGFLTTLLTSRLVDHIQSAGNQFLGLHLYAQQVVSAVSFILMLITIVYLNTVVKAIAKKAERQTNFFNFGIDKTKKW